ncbi:MAG: response regulator [Lachnospiraceae bacterium]|nr:response regulator [Lachnospiraceae bacterium]
MSGLRDLVIVGSTEGILARGLRNKLSGFGIDVVFAGMDTVKLKEVKDNTGIYLIELKEDVDDLQYALGRIRENIASSVARIIVIAQKDDQTDLKRKHPDLASRVTDWYEHGFDMDEFSKYVRTSLENEVVAPTKVESGGVKNILIVDDDPTYAKMVREWLKDFYHVSVVVNAMQAINFMNTHQLDLVLLDYEMPVVSGPQVFEMMKNEPETCNIPVMFLTGVGDPASVSKVIALKPAGYMLKSATREDLLNKLIAFFK